MNEIFFGSSVDGKVYALDGATAVGNPPALRNRLLFTDLIDHTLEIVDLE